MGKFVTSIEVEAYQADMFGVLQMPKEFRRALCACTAGARLGGPVHLHTVIGVKPVDHGDWLIMEPAGTFISVSAATFEDRFAPVPE